MRVPCCNAAVGLNRLRFENPIGFARFEVSAMNGTWVKHDFDTEELSQVASLLGRPVEQVLAHY